MKKNTAPEANTSDYVSTTDDGDDGTSNDMDDIDLDEDEEEEEDSFGETKEAIALRDDLNDLQTEINIKERLISELEKSERRLQEVRLTYERKLTELSLRIQQTETERDRILAEKLSKKGDNASQEQAKRIREEYERKLADMKAEFRKLQAVEREHKLMQARQQKDREQMVRYQGELGELKRTKVGRGEKTETKTFAGGSGQKIEGGGEAGTATGPSQCEETGYSGQGEETEGQQNTTAGEQGPAKGTVHQKDERGNPAAEETTEGAGEGGRRMDSGDDAV